MEEYCALFFVSLKFKLIKKPLKYGNILMASSCTDFSATQI